MFLEFDILVDVSDNNTSQLFWKLLLSDQPKNQR